MPDKNLLVRSARFLALPVALLLSSAGNAPAQTPLADSAVTRGGLPKSHADSTHKSVMSGPGALDSLLAQADRAVKARGGVHAENAQLYLSWNAPWGQKRAKQVRMPACDDSTRADTLYLSFYPGRTSEHFSGVTAQVRFLATGTDTLGPWWHMESKGGENGGNIRVEWGPSPDMPGPQPWRVEGHGFAMLERTSTAVRLQLLYAETLDDAGPNAANVTYTLCRVIIHHRPSRKLAGCEQPVAVQWLQATLGYALKDEPKVSRGERFVSYSGPLSICDAFRESGVQMLKPKLPGSK